MYKGHDAVLCEHAKGMNPAPVCSGQVDMTPCVCSNAALPGIKNILI